MKPDHPQTTAPEPPELEKKRRVYYQSIVYDVAIILDRFNNRKPGFGVVCGSIHEPSKALQEDLQMSLSEASAYSVNVVDLAEAIRDVGNWKGTRVGDILERMGL